ncbi:PRC-barrel domain containing protein [Promicromonospora kroppenstedtii]|uniref:PRC-barrel domain containing protein n=1 Tax=Promicromonospora kroppenstedtii TaxID=440482 RepID=A0ABW7XFD0_9MICO
MNVGDLLDARVLGPDGATLGVVVDVRFALEVVDEPDDDARERDREDPETPLSAHLDRDAVAGARLVGLLVSPHSGGSFLGYERTEMRSPWPIAQLVRRRHRGTFLAGWSDVAEVRTDSSPVIVRLVAGFERGSPAL